MNINNGKMKFSVIPVAGAVLFPHSSISIELTKRYEHKAFEKAYKGNERVVLIPQLDPTESDPNFDGFHKIGTVADISEFVRKENGDVAALFSGIFCVNIEEIIPNDEDGCYEALCVRQSLSLRTRNESAAYMAEAKSVGREYIKNIKLYKPIASALADQLESMDSPTKLADFMASNFLSSYNDRISVYLEKSPKARLKKTVDLVVASVEIAELRNKIQSKVKERSDRSHKEYYLNEQLRAIREELGDDGDSDIVEYKKLVNESKMPAPMKEKLLKEVAKLARMPISSAEYNVATNYIDVCLELPWGVRDEDRIDVSLAQKILERDHYGLEKVKERILEYLAVRKLTPNIKNQILCLVGPPGTGKTSIARSVAEAMGRKYVRVSLGGVRDEADIRGHRKTYVASMPGRIIEGIKRAKTTNPVMLLDEIDKLTRDSHGDPASALMEVLDSEQNKEFRDHFIEAPFDLSEVVFIATANTLDTIPRPLLDRMEIISLECYSAEEKLAIAKKYLVPKQMERHGVTKNQFKITDSALKAIIGSYTKEAGVRNLEREIASVCRKAAKKLVDLGEEKSLSVSAKNISEYLGPEKIMPETVSGEDEVGVVNGLAYTELGGALLKVEVASMPGTGKVECTGSLGDVMKESAKAAVSYIRSHCDEWNIESDFYSKKDIHIHFPEGAVPKDGPSAGVTMVSALVSELSGKPVKHDIAMTGEVTLKGKVLAIGGLKEKTMAAYNAGVKTVLIPFENVKDLAKIDKKVRENLTFIPCKDVKEVLKNAIV